MNAANVKIQEPRDDKPHIPIRISGAKLNVERGACNGDCFVYESDDEIEGDSDVGLGYYKRTRFCSCMLYKCPTCEDVAPALCYNMHFGVCWECATLGKRCDTNTQTYTAFTSRERSDPGLPHDKSQIPVKINDVKLNIQSYVCNGGCFIQYDSEDDAVHDAKDDVDIYLGYRRTRPCSCMLYKCPTCDTVAPAWYINCNKGMCGNCAIMGGCRDPDIQTYTAFASPKHSHLIR